jgi:hypothetical protein
VQPWIGRRVTLYELAGSFPRKVTVLLREILGALIDEKG